MTANHLPPLPEPDHSLDNGTLHFYTAEQVEQIRREAVEADRRARADKLLTEKELADPEYMREYVGELREIAREMADYWRAQLARQSQEPQAERDAELFDELHDALTECINHERNIKDWRAADHWRDILKQFEAWRAAPAHPVAHPAPADQKERS